ncbi:MAG TPA: 4-hydroxy-3-methylbut-2-en-1-yl diphosphate synthase [Gammaproteobacteria bacterium]|nr:4-hydroxy-3-methylbut-2-en-1-yl diphosphate synthase [Gammaproteobacteria bacterium]
MARNLTRTIDIGNLKIGSDTAIVIQSMCATPTRDIDATVGQVVQLHHAGAGIIRIAVDNNRDAVALKEIRQQTDACLSVDLQENYRVAVNVAPWVDKIRYNPGHLHHHERRKTWQQKVRFLVDVARDHDCALRVGINCGSVDPRLLEQQPQQDTPAAMLQSALEHCSFLDDIGFERYVVSLKDSDPYRVITANQHFAAARPDVPLHLGVTEAGMPPDGITKTRIAFEPLLGAGIGDTIRVSLTLPFEKKCNEIEAGRMILDDIAAGRMLNPVLNPMRLNIISCPSCSRVENEAFIELASDVKSLAGYARDQAITIAVMGCRVNGPGETNSADIGLWCGPKKVNLKRGEVDVGAFSYNEILPQVRIELDRLIAKKR